MVIPWTNYKVLLLTQNVRLVCHKLGLTPLLLCKKPFYGHSL